MSRFKARVAALERVSAFIESPVDLMILMNAAPDRGKAMFAALSPAQQRAYREWCRSGADEGLIRRLLEDKVGREGSA